MTAWLIVIVYFLLALIAVESVQRMATKRKARYHARRR